MSSTCTCTFPYEDDSPIHKVRSLSLEGHPLGYDNGAAILQALCVGGGEVVGSTDPVLGELCQLC